VSQRSARLSRGLRKRCPRCGERDVWSSYFELHERCPRCGFGFEREEGYWVGAMTVIIALTEMVFGIVFVGGMVVTWPDVPWTALLVTGLVLNAVVPIVFYPWAKTTWLGLELSFTGPTATEEAESLAALEGDRVSEDEHLGDR
jgi:uncharacterized protein (DUF983 family)